jgi:hypothetical protein
MNKVNVPDFFILGAAKSGTTSLYVYLQSHPQILMSSYKEPTFFCEPFQVVANPIDYFRQFEGATPNHRRFGDASHGYLTNPTTAPVLKALFPSAKFIVILRNPADRAHALYHHMVRNGDEWIGSFEAALRAENARLHSHWFREHCPQYFHNYLYFHSGLYSQQIAAYFGLFPRSAFHLLTLESFRENPGEHLRRILEFLDVDPHHHPDFLAHNEGRTTARIPWLEFAWNEYVKYPRSLAYLGQSLLKRFNRKPIPTLDSRLRTDLLARYHDDIIQLQNLTGLDVEHWLPAKRQDHGRRASAHVRIDRAGTMAS